MRKKAIDEHKDDQLNKQKEGKGHWKGELSSNSESAVCLPYRRIEQEKKRKVTRLNS